MRPETISSTVHRTTGLSRWRTRGRLLILLPALVVAIGAWQAPLPKQVMARLRLDAADASPHMLASDPIIAGKATKLTADDGAARDLFGRSVAVDGDTLVIGSIYADVDGKKDKGAAYVFTRAPSGAGPRPGSSSRSSRWPTPSCCSAMRC